MSDLTPTIAPSEAIIIDAPSAIIRSSPSPTLDLAIAAWLDAKSARSKSVKTQRAYQDGMTSFRATLAGVGLDLDSPPATIALIAQGWAGRSTSDEVAPATYNQRLAIVSSFYTFARKRQLLAVDNPIDLVERRRVEDYASAHAIDESDIRRRLKAINRTELAGLRDYALLGIYVQTGKRLSEIAGLEWRDLDIQGERVTFHIRRGKGGKVFADRLPPGPSKALMNWLYHYYGADLGQLAPATPVWVSLSRNSRGRALSIRSVATICEERLGVSKVHALRHTFAHTMEAAGAKLSDIQSRLGHSSLATTGRYLSALKRAENIHADELAHRFGLDEE